MKDQNNLFSAPMAILLGAFMISISILLAGGVIKMGKPLPGVVGIQAMNPLASTAPTQPVVPAAAPTSAKVSVDDDPVLGDKNAPVTLIEFSDYECPFCKRHYEETYSQLKRDYIDTGKVKLVYRDYPLPFHDPLATTEAIAANCARDQGGDVAYFKIHDEMFTQTTSNGNGLSKEKLWKIAGDLGLNVDNFKSCVEVEKSKDEVSKDISDGVAVGVSGTPSFFIGKSNANGIIEGKMLVGAQPLATFKTAIEEALK